jgi:hypothetical protein
LWARHEGLRSVFVAEGGEPHVELLDADAGFGLIEDDLRGDDEAPARLAELCGKPRMPRSIWRVARSSGAD